MSLRLPQNLDTTPTSERALGNFEREVLAEKAASLGRAGRRLAAALDRLKQAGDGPREALVMAAAEAAHAFLVQRELCGFRDDAAVIADYAIPGEVLARVGAR